MQAITTIGLDIAKSVFQVHGVDAGGQVVLRRQLKRRYVLAFFGKLAPCLVGIEACASSHYWARRLQALGHNVRLMPPAYVKPYVKRQKNDSTDAEAICEAVSRANMRFVPTKTPEQQSGLVLHRTRHLFIRQQTSVINAIRAHCAEFGIVAPVGRRGVEELLNVIANAKDEQVPAIARACVVALGAQLHRGQTADSGVRSYDYSLAPVLRHEQTTRRDSGCRSGARHRSCRQRCQPESIPIGARLLGLDRASAQAELERRQAKARQHQQTGRSLSTRPVHGRRTRRDPLRQNPRHQAPTMAHRIVSAAADQGRSHRTRQQDCQNGMGDDD